VSFKTSTTLVRTELCVTAWRTPGCLSSGGPLWPTTAGPTATRSRRVSAGQPLSAFYARAASAPFRVRASGAASSRPAKSWFGNGQRLRSDFNPIQR